MLCVRETWPVKERNVTRLERNHARMVRRIGNVMPQDKISTEENLRARWECVQDRRLP